MGLINTIKAQSKKIASMHRDRGSQTREAVDWNEVYVEIDNDANETAGSSRSGRSEGIASGSMDSDSRASTNHSFESRSYAAMENGDSNVTPSFSNMTDVVTAGINDNPTLTENQFSQSEYPPVDIHKVRKNLPNVQSSTTNDYTITKDGRFLSSNHFANAQLMGWKRATEEGPCIIKVLALLASFSAIFTTIYPLITDDQFWTVPGGICAFHTTVSCVLIIAFDITAWGFARNPFSLRAKMRNAFVGYFNILRFVWGRGFLYVFAGSMNITVSFYPYTYYSGLSLMVLGLFSILVGAHAAFNLDRLRLSLTDHSYLWSMFVKADSDQDTLIGLNDFSNLIWSLGLELDDTYTYLAFSEIDHDDDARIDFSEFKTWWIGGMANQDGDETVFSMDMSRKTAGS